MSSSPFISVENASAVREPCPTGPHRYRAFGGVIESDLEFPELAYASDSEQLRWTLRVDECPPPAVDVIARGERRLGPEAYSLSQTPHGYRLEYSHAGVFDVSERGSLIVWYRRCDTLPELVRAIVLGPALALALELTGRLCLHGSAVTIGDRAVVFVGPKHHGKSTLATALTAAGARLIGDDLIAVAPGPPAMILPGVASVRLWADAIAALPMRSICDRLIGGIKTTATGFADTAMTDEQTPVAVVYVLEPVPAADGRACWRTRLSLGAAAIGLAQQTKLADSLVGMNAAGSQLARAARLAETVPIWTLSTVRDLARLSEVVEQLFAWHQEAPA